MWLLRGRHRDGLHRERQCESCVKSVHGCWTRAALPAGHAKIAACYPRAVRWLFHAAQSPLPKEGVEILNMREQKAEDVVRSLLGEKSA